MPDQIINHLDLDSRFLRSIALDRDLEDPKALDTYLITSSAISAVQQIGQTLAERRPQRAWKIIGPYGSGKSALGLLIAHLLEGPKRHKRLFEQLTLSAPDAAQLFRPGKNVLPVAVVGSRSSLGEALARQLLKCTEGWAKTKLTSAWKKRLDLENKQYSGQALTASIGDVLQDFIAAAQDQGFSGVLLLVDELGKFVEHAALYPDDGDLMVLQRIAELSCRPDDASLIVVTMLHQHFGEYARGVGRSLEDEWHKVAARFEEIAFDEPVERYAQFASHALSVSEAITSNKAIQKQARRLYDTAKSMSFLNLKSSGDAFLETDPTCLYPLHPLVISSMAIIAKRFGQSERSFHAFLRSHEPFSLRDYASRTKVGADSWMTLPSIFDFLASSHGLRFRDLTIERKWAFACAVSTRAETENPVELAAFKCVAVLELVGAALRLSPNTQLIQHALDNEFDPSLITLALQALTERGLLLHRKQRDDFVLAVSEAINIEAVFDSTAERAEAELLLHGIRGLLGDSPVIASRHYDNTGTIRSMAVQVGTLEGWPVRQEKADGAFCVVLVDQQSNNQLSLAEQKVAACDDPLALYSVLSLSAEAKLALMNYSRWCLSLEQVNQKSIDPWSSKYVEAKVLESREEVERVVMTMLNPQADNPTAGFYHLGTRVPESAQMNLNRAASWLFDTVFHSSPRLINELINKDAPTPAIVLARQKLFDLIISAKTDEPFFRSSEFPPERLIAWTLLRQTGILAEDKQGHWSIQEPVANATVDITHVWLRIGELLRAEDRPTFSDVLDCLAEAPLGLRAGPAGIWVVTYLITRRRSCAIFERNTFVLELTNEHIARMFRNPHQFELRELDLNAEKESLLFDYRSALASVGFEPQGALSYVEIARALIRWATRLTEYSMQTTTVSADAKLVRTSLKRATDPVQLLTEELPEIFKRTKNSQRTFNTWLSACLGEISLSHRKLQEDVTRALSDAFALPGGLKQIRAQLQQECGEAASEVADAQLKSFILRCADLTLTDEKWLDSIASLIVHRPLDAWTDDTFAKFKEAITDLFGHYKRWIRLIQQSGKGKRVGERFLAITMTMQGGEENSVFLPANEQAKEQALTLVDSTLKQTHGNTEMALAILAQALTTLHTQTTAQRNDRDERKTS